MSRHLLVALVAVITGAAFVGGCAQEPEAPEAPDPSEMTGASAEALAQHGIATWETRASEEADVVRGWSADGKLLFAAKIGKRPIREQAIALSFTAPAAQLFEIGKDGAKPLGSYSSTAPIEMLGRYAADHKTNLPEGLIAGEGGVIAGIDAVIQCAGATAGCLNPLGACRLSSMWEGMSFDEAQRWCCLVAVIECST
jgi:hypothetical protein